MRFLYPDNDALTEYTEPIHFYMPPYLDSERLIQVLDEYNSYFPNVTVSILPRPEEESFEFLREDRRGILLLPTHEAIENVQTCLDDMLSFSVLQSFSLILIAASTNERAKAYQHSAIPIKEALALDLIILASDLQASFVYQTIRSYGEPNVKFMVDNPMVALRLLRQKNWFMFASESQMQNQEKVFGIPLKEDIICNLFLVYHSDVMRQFDAGSFVALVQNRCSK